MSSSEDAADEARGGDDDVHGVASVPDNFDDGGAGGGADDNDTDDNDERDARGVALILSVAYASPS
jgi:hypothetical protein